MKSKDKTYLNIYLLEIGIAIIGTILFCKAATNSFANYNGFSFYRSLKSSPYCLGDVFMMITVLLSMIGITNKFLMEINTGFFLNKIEKNNYNRYVVSSILGVHIKSFLLQFINIGILIFGIVVLGDKLIPNDTSYLSGFYAEGINSPYIYMIKLFISGFLMTNILGNLALIINRIIKKNTITYIATFVVFNALNLLVNILFKQNIYYGYAPPIEGINSVMLMYVILEIITLVIGYAVYRNKEKIVLSYGK